MAFWSDSSFEPLKKNRFIMRLFDSSVMIELKSVNLPTFETDVLEQKLINHIIKYPSIGKWSDISMTFVITSDLLQRTFLRASGYRNIRNNGQTLNKDIQSIGLGNVTIDILKGDGTAISTWTIHNPFVSTINYGELSYESDDFVEVDLTLAFDYAEIQ